MLAASIVALFKNTLDGAERDARAWRDDPAHAGFDRKTAAICLLATVCLTLGKYVGAESNAVAVLNTVGVTLTRPADLRLYLLAWWAGSIIFFYFVVPVLCVRFVLGEPLSEYGFALGAGLRDYPAYVAMVLVMIPLILLMSRTAAFQARYPFYAVQPGEGLSRNLLLWEAIYLGQFVAVEFFFRGFLLHGTKHRFGYYAVFVMVAPYCMIHFVKPLPEALAAIVSGIVLGTFSLRSRSIWLGVAVHCSVAGGMDLAALWQKHLL